MSANKLIVILAGIIFAICTIGAFFLGRTTKKIDSAGVKVKRDTVVVYDTVTERYPEYVTQWETRTERVEVPTVIRDTVRDTILVNLPITERVYEGKDYRAVIEGWNPVLKEMTTYPATKYITVTETVTKRKRWGVSIGAQGGYGITPEGMQPYAGIGITVGYNF